LCRTDLATCGGMVYRAMEYMVVLANLASGEALRRTLCSSKSGFEGSGVGASPLVVVLTQNVHSTPITQQAEKLASHAQRESDVPVNFS
jgi:hypothetical protein